MWDRIAVTFFGFLGLLVTIADPSFFCSTSSHPFSLRFQLPCYPLRVQRLLKQKKIKGHIQPGKQGGTIPSELDGYSAQLAQMVDKYPDATPSEYCEYWG
jgi:hypothetical protein